MTASSTVPSDIEIAQAAKMEPIQAIAEKMGLTGDDIELYGRNMAKVQLEVIDKLKERPNAKYIVVTAITPTPLGEGKSTTTVGLGQGMEPYRQDAPPSPSASRRWGRPSASKAARPAAATARSCRWRSSTCT